MPAPSLRLATRHPVLLLAIGLTLSVASACSGDDAPLADGFNGAPTTLSISGISLSRGNVLDGGSSALPCDHKLGVALTAENFYLRTPGACSIKQCGRAHVDLIDPAKKSVSSGDFASLGASLDLSQYFPAAGEPLLSAGMYTVNVKLIDDSGNDYNGPGKLSDSVVFQVDLPSGCDAASGGSGGGSAGGAASMTEGGAAGALTGSGGVADSAGAAGDPTAGSAGVAGAADVTADSGAGGA